MYSDNGKLVRDSIFGSNGSALICKLSDSCEDIVGVRDCGDDVTTFNVTALENIGVPNTRPACDPVSKTALSTDRVFGSDESICIFKSDLAITGLPILSSRCEIPISSFWPVAKIGSRSTLANLSSYNAPLVQSPCTIFLFVFLHTCATVVKFPAGETK